MIGVNAVIGALTFVARANGRCAPPQPLGTPATFVFRGGAARLYRVARLECASSEGQLAVRPLEKVTILRQSRRIVTLAKPGCLTAYYQREPSGSRSRKNPTHHARQGRSMRGAGRSGHSRWPQMRVRQHGDNTDQFQVLQKPVRERATENGITVGLPCQPWSRGEAAKPGGCDAHSVEVAAIKSSATRLEREKGCAKVPAGKTLDRKDQPLMIKVKGKVEAFYR